MRGIIQIIQGGQWGSEAKGAIAAEFCIRENVDVAVRTGATNAGHTVVYNGTAVKMQQLPCGWVNPETKLVIGAGALVDPTILAREIDLIRELTGRDVRDRLFVDRRAALHLPHHAQRSKESGRHHAMGATGKGCSEALIDRIAMRGNLGAAVTLEQAGYGNNYSLDDTEQFLNSMYDKGAKIQLEATQGTLLDLALGPYPYVTHKQTGPAQWMMEAGLSPTLRTDVVMVLRTYPIRVAGNSGPMAHEISWPLLARAINVKLTNRGKDPLVGEWAIQAFEDEVRAATFSNWAVPTGSDGLNQHLWSAQQRVIHQEALSEIHADALRSLSPAVLAELSKLFELTTVTKKLRRVAQLSHVETQTAIRQVRPHRIVLTFLNYILPQFWGESIPVTGVEREYLEVIERTAGVDPGTITHVNRGPHPEHIIEVAVKE